MATSELEKRVREIVRGHIDVGEIAGAVTVVARGKMSKLLMHKVPLTSTPHSN
ncbi:hypothetical protein [Nocardia asiatica]|uniref:hypothetical protein n=1 Tax=Nocardia asiatica TaxID=209252 RepID=UPI0002F5A6A9|nr:hypothetical protein [Nocardia asiatica]